MARLSQSQRDKLPSKSFAQPAQRAYPIEDLAHARNALSRAAQFASPGERSEIRAKVCNRYPMIESCRQHGKE